MSQPYPYQRDGVYYRLLIRVDCFNCSNSFLKLLSRNRDFNFQLWFA